MTYTTLDILTDTFSAAMLVSLTDRGDIPTGVVDVDVVGRVLADTDAIIDGYVAAKYTLPIVGDAPILGELAQSIAIYKLHIYSPDAKIEQDYKDAIQSLRAISSGSIRLSIEGHAPASTGGTGVRITDRKRPMVAGKMGGYI